MFLSCFHAPWPCTAAGWNPRCSPAPVQSWNAFDHTWSTEKSSLMRPSPLDCHISSVENIWSWQLIWTTFMSRLTSTCKEHTMNSVHVTNSVSPRLQCQVRHFSPVYQSSSLPNSAPSQAKHTSCCLQMPHVTSSGMFSPGYVENSLVKVQIIPFGFPSLVLAAIPTDHSIDFVSPEVTRWPSALFS